MSPLFEIDNESRANHPNIHTDAMFPAKAFDALVELIEAAAKRKGEQVYEPLDHVEPGLPRTLIHASGSEVLLSDARKGRAHAGRRRGARRAADLARSDARLPARVAPGVGSQAVVAPDRRIHSRGHLVSSGRA